MKLLQLFLLVSLCSAFALAQQYATNYYGPPGDPSGNFPTYFERSIVTWINVVRANPIGYRNAYLLGLTDASVQNIFATSTFGPIAGFTYNLDLNRVARAHTLDILNNCPTTNDPHSSCNGTSFSDRLAQWTNTATGETFWYYANFGQSFLNWPFFAVAGWICDGSLFSNGALTNCPDDANALHRSILLTEVGEIGCAVAGIGTNFTATCDTGDGVPPANFSQSPIVSVAHVYNGDVSGYAVFAVVSSLANRIEGTTLTSITLVQDGTVFPMGLALGVNDLGVWSSGNFSVGGCSQYWVLATFSSSQGDLTYTYPTDGSFFTFGTSTGCTTDYTTERLLPAEPSPSAAVPSVSIPAESPSPVVPSISTPEESPSPVVPSISTPEESPSPVVPSISIPEESPSPVEPSISIPEESPSPVVPSISIPEESPSPQEPSLSLPEPSPSPELPSDSTTPTISLSGSISLSNTPEPSVTSSISITASNSVNPSATPSISVTSFEDDFPRPTRRPRRSPTPTQTPPTPTCGNGIIEGNEHCDGGECCRACRNYRRFCETNNECLRSPRCVLGSCQYRIRTGRSCTIDNGGGPTRGSCDASGSCVV